MPPKKNTDKLTRNTTKKKQKKVKICTERTRLCGKKECMICFPKTFASSKRAKHWDYEKNKLKPWELGLHSHKICWFNCPKEDCGHPFDMQLGSVTHGHWCRFCSGNDMCPAEDNCQACFNKSCANHDEMAARWSSRNNKKACEVALYCHLPYELKCPDTKCLHYYKVMPKSVMTKNSSCPFCAHQKLCPVEDNCKICYEKTCASHPLMRKFWAPTNKVSASQTFLNCNNKRDFICDKCPSGKNTFRMSPNTVVNMKCWCPNCVNKTEKKLRNWLLKRGYDLGDVRFNWCRNPKTGRYLPFDFVIEKFKLIIELDGDQHFQQVGNRKNHTETTENDARKMNLAGRQGYSVIRIYQPDVWNDKNDWKNKLLKCLKAYKTPQQIFISSKRDIYDPLKLALNGKSVRKMLDVSTESDEIPRKKNNCGAKRCHIALIKSD